MEPSIEIVPAPAIAPTPPDYRTPYQRPQDVHHAFLTDPMTSDLPYEEDLRTRLPFIAISPPIQYFRLLLNDAALNLLTSNSNAYAALKIAQIKAAGKPMRDWQPLSKYDVQMWIGILLFMGVRGIQQAGDCWSDQARSRIWQIADYMP